MFSGSYAFLHSRKRGMVWKHISEMLIKEAEEGKRAQTFTSPGSAVASHYQNSSLPSAGRLPLPLTVFRPGRKAPHHRKLNDTSPCCGHHGEYIGDVLPLELAFSLLWVYLCTGDSCKSCFPSSSSLHPTPFSLSLSLFSSYWKSWDI